MLTPHFRWRKIGPPSGATVFFVWQSLLLLSYLTWVVLSSMLGDHNRDFYGFSNGNRLLVAEELVVAGMVVTLFGLFSVSIKLRVAILGIAVLAVGCWLLGQFLMQTQDAPFALERVSDQARAIGDMQAEGKTDAYTEAEWDRLLSQARAELAARQLELRAAELRDYSGYPGSRVGSWYLRVVTGVYVVLGAILVASRRAGERK